MSDSSPGSRAAAEDYRRGLSFIDAAFDAARLEGDRVLPCGRGCSSCCAGLFDVHRADAALLLAWLDRQDDATREAVARKARDLVTEARAAAEALVEAGESSLEGWEPLEDGLDGLPAGVVTQLASRIRSSCPLLGGQGECLAHAERPSLCRLQGLPWRDPGTGRELPDFCRLDPAMAGNRPQELDLARLDALRHEAGEAIRRASGKAGGLPGRSFVAAVLAPTQTA